MPQSIGQRVRTRSELARLAWMDSPTGPVIHWIVTHRPRGLGRIVRLRSHVSWAWIALVVVHVDVKKLRRIPRGTPDRHRIAGSTTSVG